MSWNILSQIFGAKEGHVLNADIDSVGILLGKNLGLLTVQTLGTAGSAYLASKGYPATLQGAAQLAVAAIKTEEATFLAGIPPAAAADVEAALNTILTAVANAVPSIVV